MADQLGERSLWMQPRRCLGQAEVVLLKVKYTTCGHVRLLFSHQRGETYVTMFTFLLWTLGGPFAGPWLAVWPGHHGTRECQGVYAQELTRLITRLTIKIDTWSWCDTSPATCRAVLMGSQWFPRRTWAIQAEISLGQYLQLAPMYLFNLSVIHNQVSIINYKIPQ